MGCIVVTTFLGFFFFSLQELLHSSRRLSLKVLSFVQSFQVRKKNGVDYRLFLIQSSLPLTIDKCPCVARMASSPLTLTVASQTLSVNPWRSRGFPCQPATSSSRTGSWRSGAAGPLLLSTSQLSRRTSPPKPLPFPEKKLPDLVLRRSPTQPHIVIPDNKQTAVQSSVGYQSQESPFWQHQFKLPRSPAPRFLFWVTRPCHRWVVLFCRQTPYHQETLLNGNTSSVPDPKPTSAGCCVVLERSTSSASHCINVQVFNRRLWQYASSGPGLRSRVQTETPVPSLCRLKLSGLMHDTVAQVVPPYFSIQLLGHFFYYYLHCAGFMR